MKTDCDKLFSWNALAHVAYGLTNGFALLSTKAERRQSTMFTIDNTPKNSNYLKKGLNKLRSSTRKSPGKSSKKSPAQTSARKCQENIPSRTSHASVKRAGKSTHVAAKGQRTSPRVTSRTAKSPGLTASARKVNTHKCILRFAEHT